MSFYDYAINNNQVWSPRDFMLDADTSLDLISYFTLSDDSITDLQTRIVKNEQPGDSEYYSEILDLIPMWKFLVVGFNENHSESFSLDKGLSESFTIMSTGTSAIRVSLTGFLYMQKELDYRLDFLYIYDNFFRGYKLEENGIELQVVMENTIFNFKPFNVSYHQDTTMPEFVKLAMQGIAYKYSVLEDGSTSLLAVTGL